MPKKYVKNENTTKRLKVDSCFWHSGSPSSKPSDDYRVRKPNERQSVNSTLNTI